jgi:Cof subfamily protein (haloacid dehalogenase superfamily)
MELIVFDLDGTLLDKTSTITPYTRDTLRLLADKGIAYTVATGRTLHASREVIAGHGFHLPHIYKNGVVIWHPQSGSFSHRNVLTHGELERVVQACLQSRVTPFLFTLDDHDEHFVYHPPLQNPELERSVGEYSLSRGLQIRPLEDLPADAAITNVSAIGEPASIERIIDFVAGQSHLVAYSGVAIEKPGRVWLDIHHSDASKGGAIDILRDMLDVRRVICFGDSDNDLSMFARADESYAPANAKDSVKAAASGVIGHHDEEGIAQFLRSRFDLGDV